MARKTRANRSKARRGGAKKSRSTRRTKTRSGGGKRKMNAFMKALISAKKGGAGSFQYGGKTYQRHVGTKRNPKFVYYKKA
jgi:osmotically-inducible protein OsmY